MTTESAYVRLRPTPQTRLRLFCFPHGGGGTSLFYGWKRHLPPTVEICPLHLPGREGRFRERRHTNLTELAEEIAAAIAPCQDLPFAFLGYSLGGFVGFEVARRLRSERLPSPVHYLIGAVRAPHVPNPHPPIYHLRDDAFIAALTSRYGPLHADPVQNAELLRMFLPSLIADVTMLETYVYEPEPPLPCPIAVFTGDADHSTLPHEAAAWEEQTSEAFRLHTFAGGHFFLNENREEFLKTIMQELNSYL